MDSRPTARPAQAMPCHDVQYTLLCAPYLNAIMPCHHVDNTPSRVSPYPQVRRVADQCLDVIMDTDEEWAVRIRNLKFESFNQEWLDVVSTPPGQVGGWVGARVCVCVGGWVFLCVLVCACVRACMRACMRLFRTCVCVYVCAFWGVCMGVWVGQVGGHELVCSA